MFSFKSWVRNLRQRFDAPTPNSRSAKSRQSRRTLGVEVLEDRSVPSAVLSGFNSFNLPANDDGSTAQIALPFSLNFFGRTFSSTYVNNNGNLTFSGPLSTFTPFGLTTNTSTPIIAPFFADVWTFGVSGTVTYGTGVVDGHTAFGATWPHVDYYSDSTGSKQNTFQVLLIDRSDTGSGNFDMEFNYDQIQWETGNASSGSGGLGGSSAHVGYSNGTGNSGTFFELNGSGLDGAFLDSNHSTGLIYNNINSSVSGRYVFQARNGTVNRPPVANAGGPYSIQLGQPLTLDGTGSSDPDNDSLTYSWTINGHAGAASGANPTLTWSQLQSLGINPNQSYSVAVTVNDGHGNVVTSTTTLSVIGKQDQTIAFAPLADKTFGDGPFTVGATSSSGLPVGFSIVSGPATYDPATGAVTITGAGVVTIEASQAGDSTYNAAAPVEQSFTVARAMPTVTVGSVSATYDGTAHGTTGTVTGVGGVSLGAAVISYSSGSAPVDAGSYTATGSFAGDTNYLPASGNASIDIARADASITVNPYTGTYDANSHGLTGSATGVGGVDLGGLLHLGGTYTNAGHYDVAWSFDGSANYNAASGSSTVDIAKAQAHASIAGPVSATYDGAAHGTTGQVVGVNGEVLASAVSYNSGSAPVDAGSYTATVSYAGDANYLGDTASTTIAIAKADAVISVSGYTGVYDGQSHGLTGSATGVGGTDLSALLNLGAGQTDAGSYLVAWSFAGNGNYNASSGTAAIAIAKATPTVAVTGGNFIFDGQVHAATGSVTGVNGASLGTPTFTYSYVDNSGNTIVLAGAPTDPGYYTVTASFSGDGNYLPNSASASITIAYDVRTTTDLGRLFNSGRTIPIKLELTDAAGDNLSSAGISVTALRLVRVNADGSTTEVSLQDSGSANPNNLFRYVGDGYIFNLSTKGLTAGNYQFYWVAAGDPTEHKLTFTLV